MATSVLQTISKEFAAAAAVAGNNVVAVQCSTLAAYQRHRMLFDRKSKHRILVIRAAH
jgi:hypothetical protein